MFAETQFQNYDIICLQETFASLSGRRQMLIELARKHGLTHVAAGKKQSIFRLRVDAGLLVLSRFPVLAVDEWTFQRGTEVGDWLAAKGVMYAKIQIHPRDETNRGTSTSKPCNIHLFSTHLQSTDSPRALVLRKKQYFESKRFIDSMLQQHSRQPSEPVLYVGDMNVDARAGPEDGINHASEYATMMNIYSGVTPDETLPESAKPGRYDVVDVCYKVMGEHPITTSKLVIGPGRPDPDRKCIDFILSFQATEDGQPLVEAQQNISFENVRIETLAVAGQPFSFLSDHLGVAADLMVKDQ